MGKDRLDMWRRAGTAVGAVVIRAKLGRGHRYLVAAEVHWIAGDLRVIVVRKGAGELIVGGRHLEVSERLQNHASHVLTGDPLRLGTFVRSGGSSNMVV